jgi:IS5 family transposase
MTTPVNGWARLEYCSFDAYHEAGNLQDIVERFRNREGRYPKRILADKIYRNRENSNYCKEHGIRLSGPALGRPKKDAVMDRRQDFMNECERTEAERSFSLAKRKCGLGQVTARLRETSAHVIAMSVLMLNLRRIQHVLLQFLLNFFSRFFSNGKLVFVQ